MNLRHTQLIHYYMTLRDPGKPPSGDAGENVTSCCEIRKKIMLYDHRTYTCRPNTIRKHLALYGEFGYDVQRRHLGDPVVYAAVDAGNVNSYVHIWCYADADDRSARRAALATDPQWQTYLAKSAEAGYLVSQVNQLMTPVPFFSPPQS